MTVDELVDEHWPRRGQCLICGVPGEDQRHRIMDAAVGMVLAGDSAEHVAEEYGVTLLAVAVALLDWAERAERHCPKCRAPSH